MKCRNCGKTKIASVSGKTSDMCYWRYGRAERDGYVPSGMGIGEEFGDYIAFDYCVWCGIPGQVISIDPAYNLFQ